MQKWLMAMHVSYSQTLGAESEAVGPFLMVFESSCCVCMHVLCLICSQSKEISCGDFNMLDSNSETKLYTQLSWQLYY